MFVFLVETFSLPVHIPTNMLSSPRSENDVVEKNTFKGIMSKECMEKLVKIWSKETTQLPIFKDLPRLIRGISVYENDQKVRLFTHPLYFIS